MAAQGKYRPEPNHSVTRYETKVTHFKPFNRHSDKQEHNMSKETAISIYSIAIIFCIVIIAGSLDRQEAKYQAEHYCQMVNEGTWPNYKDIDCKVK